jgi:plasmid stability protein
MAAIIIRDLNDNLGAALKREAKKRATSVNKLVQQYIAAGLQHSSAVAKPEQRNDLAAFAGRWGSKDLREFNAATDSFNQIEADLWK